MRRQYQRLVDRFYPEWRAERSGIDYRAVTRHGLPITAWLPSMAKVRKAIIAEAVKHAAARNASGIPPGTLA
jgi:hypothetical protein